MELKTTSPFGTDCYFIFRRKGLPIKRHLTYLDIYPLNQREWSNTLQMLIYSIKTGVREWS